MAERKGSALRRSLRSADCFSARDVAGVGGFEDVFLKVQRVAVFSHVL